MYRDDIHIEYVPVKQDNAWIVVGEYAEIFRATRDVGLDDNVLRPAEFEEESQVVYPSNFCTDPINFLGILALLNQRGVPFRLYRKFIDDRANESYMVKVFPEPGSETKAILEAFHPSVARHLSDLRERIPFVFRQIFFGGMNDSITY